MCQGAAGWEGQESLGRECCYMLLPRQMISQLDIFQTTEADEEAKNRLGQK